MKRKLRTYEPVWLMLKEKGKAFVKCKNASQKRIIKAVIKEKYLDEEKFEMVGQLEVKQHPHGVEFNILGKLKVEDF